MRVITKNSIYEVTPVGHGFQVRKVNQLRPSPAVEVGQAFTSPWLEVTVDGVMRWYDSATGVTWHTSVVERVEP